MRNADSANALGRPAICAVVAAHNEADSIARVVDELYAAGASVIVVDDGSTDATTREAMRAGAVVLRHIANRGQGAALQTGIEFAVERGADIIVTFDADGQHDPSDLKELIQPVASGKYDVALGSRFLGTACGIPMVRRLVLKLGILFTYMVSRVWLTDVHNGLRAFSREAAASLHITMDGMAHASEIIDEIQRLHLRYVEVPVNLRYSARSLAKGQRSWNALKIMLQVVIRKLPT